MRHYNHKAYNYNMLVLILILGAFTAYLAFTN